MTTRPLRRGAALRGTAAAAAVALLCAACSPAASPPTRPADADGVTPVGEVERIAEGFTTPWSFELLGDGSTVLSERDTALVKRIDATGEVRELGQVPGVVPAGEGGLLGIATLDDDRGSWLYAYVTAADDNRVVRMPFDPDAADDAALDTAGTEVVFDGIRKAGNHNGGRIAFGPDGMLYVTTGDAGDPAASQDPESLNGKILRMTPTGEAPDDNPTPGSVVYTLGHRNPQGIAWDADGAMWAAEFGQNTWDEFNRLEAGANYGWPVVEGEGDDERFIDPVLQWPTSEASPSGLTFVGGTFFLAALRGERVWAIHPGAPAGGGGDGNAGDGAADADAAGATAWFEGEFGRIRHVQPGPDGATLRFVTSTTDGNGGAAPGSDGLYEVRLAAPVEG